MLLGVIAAFVAFWSAVALIAGLLNSWPVIVLGCLAGVVVAGVVTSVVIFRVIGRQERC